MLKDNRELFQEYQLIHNFMHPAEPLKGWINEETFTSHYVDDWNLLMPVVEKIEGIDTEEGYLDIRIEIGRTKLLNDHFSEVFMEDRGSCFENTYKVVIDFINWRNDDAPTSKEIEEYMVLHNEDEVGINNQWSYDDAEYHLLLSDKYHK